jgi:hypothetical protein
MKTYTLGENKYSGILDSSEGEKNNKKTIKK